MSEQVARNALLRMNLSAVAVAVAFATVSADLSRLAVADNDAEQKRLDARRSDLCAAYGFTSTDQRKPFAFSHGIAIIPVTGMLINRFSSSWGWVTGYNFIRSQLAQAVADEDVVGIILDCNSYGGEVAGCFETAAIVREASKKKPVLAMIDSNCYSACMAIASGASRIVSTPSGGAGSIGVVAMHVSMEKALKEYGYEITYIHFGDHKVDGNPYQALPASVKKNIQSSVDKTGATFCNLVATHRGMDLQKVIDTQAQTYSADDALALGLIDAIAPPEEAARAFLGELSGTPSSTATKGADMSTIEKPGVTENAGTTAQPTAAQPTAAAPAAPAAAASAEPTAPAAPAAAAASQPMTAEQMQTRIAGILGCEEAKGRESLANHFAFKSTMSLDDAKAALAAAPKAGTTNAFAAHMNSSTQPNVGADLAASADGGGDEKDPAKFAVAAYRAATGWNPQPAAAKTH